jgi:hypothetical protein
MVNMMVTGSKGGVIYLRAEDEERDVGRTDSQVSAEKEKA